MKRIFPLTVGFIGIALLIIPLEIRNEALRFFLVGSPTQSLREIMTSQIAAGSGRIRIKPLSPNRLEHIYLESLVAQSELLSWTPFERKVMPDVIRNRLGSHGAKYIHEALYYYKKPVQSVDIGSLARPDDIQADPLIAADRMQYVFRIASDIYYRRIRPAWNDPDNNHLGKLVFELELVQLDTDRFSVVVRWTHVSAEREIFSRSLESVVHPGNVAPSFSQDRYRAMIQDFTYELTQSMFGERTDLNLHYEKGFYFFIIAYFVDQIPDLARQVRELIEVFPKSRKQYEDWLIDHDIQERSFMPLPLSNQVTVNYGI